MKKYPFLVLLLVNYLFIIFKPLKKNKTIVIGTATTVDEGIKLEEIGCDAIVAQGYEAGGHRGTFLKDYESSTIGSFALIPQLVDAVKIPIIASGGIMDGRGLLAAINLGASIAQMGTAFIVCKESAVSTAYKKAIFESSEDSTVLTKTLSGKPARGIKNQLVSELNQHLEAIPDYPIQHYLTQMIRKEANKIGDKEFMSLYAGQGLRLAKKSDKPAAQLISDIVTEAEHILKLFNVKY